LDSAPTWQAGLGMDWRVEVGYGGAGHGRHGKARYGVDWLGGARFGRQGRAW
jgi:hypothetical protein